MDLRAEDLRWRVAGHPYEVWFWRSGSISEANVPELPRQRPLDGGWRVTRTRCVVLEVRRHVDREHRHDAVDHRHVVHRLSPRPGIRLRLRAHAAAHAGNRRKDRAVRRRHRCRGHRMGEGSHTVGQVLGEQRAAAARLPRRTFRSDIQPERLHASRRELPGRVARGARARHEAGRGIGPLRFRRAPVRRAIKAQKDGGADPTGLIETYRSKGIVFIEDDGWVGGPFRISTIRPFMPRGISSSTGAGTSTSRPM